MRFFHLVAVLLLASCASKPTYNCDEACALQGMYCSGQSIGSSVSTTYDKNTWWDLGLSSSSDSRTFHCVKDESKAEKIRQVIAEMQKRERLTELRENCLGVGLFNNYRFEHPQECAMILPAGAQK